MAAPNRRDAGLQDFLDAAHAILTLEAPRHGRVVGAAVERLFDRLARPRPAARPDAGSRPPAHRALAPALARARRVSPALAALADGLEQLEPRLPWRPGARANDQAVVLRDGYCGAIVVGAEGLEHRDDVRVGVSLMLPGVTYPDHRHPPEEIYIALSGGEWRQEVGPWRAPGRGGLVHNPPDIVHAMRATDEPLLAIWFLVAGAKSRPRGERP